MSAPLYGRAWNIQVLTPPDNAQQQTLLNISSSDRETQSLRVVFEVDQIYQEAWGAEIAIYNPNLQTIQTLDAGCMVSVSAGYAAEGTPAEIFRGVLYQAIFSKPDNVTTVLKLLCFVGLQELTDNIVQVTTGPGVTQRETVLKMAASCIRPIPIAYVAPDAEFKSQPLPRSQTIFGTPQRLFGSIARANDMVSCIGPNGLFMGPLAASGLKPDVIYAPPLSESQTQPASDGNIRYCLLGTPEQVQFGVDFRVLLDSRLQFKLPAMQVQLKNAVIEQQPFQRGQYPSILAQMVCTSSPA